MKKTISLFLSVLMIFCMIPFISATASAEESVADFMAPNNSENSYLELQINGEKHSLYFQGHCNENNLQGVDYDLESNTLTLNNYKNESTMIYVNEMGYGFKLNIVGDNSLLSINVDADKYAGSLEITGDGSLTLNKNKITENVPLYLKANNTDSKIVINDSVDFKVYSDEESICVENPSGEKPIVTNNSENYVRKTESQVSQSELKRVKETQNNMFFKVKDSQYYATYVWDENIQGNVIVAFEVFDTTINGEAVTVAKNVVDEFGNLMEINESQLDNFQTMNCLQLLYDTDAIIYTKTGDTENLYYLENYSTDKGVTWQYTVYQIIDREEIGDLFLYPIAEMKEKPKEYIEKINVYNCIGFYIFGDYSNQEEVKPHNHSITSYVSMDIKPTCTEEGYMETIFYCKDCGEEIRTETQNIPKAEHSLEAYSEAVNATCISKGLSAGYKCKNCDYKVLPKEIPMIAHSWDKGTVTKNATCSQTGVKTYKCQTPGCTKTKTETIKATGKHSYTTKVVKPTYAAKGYTLHTCKVCKKSYKDKYTAKLTVPKTAIKKITPASKKLTVSWNKKSCSGYQIQIATNSSFTKNAKLITVSSGKSVTKALSGLKAKTKYFVRVKAYQNFKGKKYYSAWSPAKTSKTK